MIKELSWSLQALIAFGLAVIFTLYMAPSPAKFQTADMLAAVSLLLGMVTIGVRRTQLVDAIKPIAPILVILAYMIAQFFLFGAIGNVPYIQQLLYGFVPYIFFYLLFRTRAQLVSHTPFFIMSLFILPGLVHVAYMYFDIGIAIRDELVSFVANSEHGLLESVKDSLRVGRRYGSVAMLHLLCGGLYMVCHFRVSPGRFWAWSLVGLSVLSLALLDARAAYCSLVIGGALMVASVGPMRAWLALRNILPAGLRFRLALVVLLAGVVAVGYSAGTSRWVAMSYSARAAVHDVFVSNEELARRPYVDAGYWKVPIEDVKKCYLEGYFRCKVDQSAYLRVAWMLEGLSAVIDHPFGIGYSDNYMGRIWGVEGDVGKYQRIDNFLVEQLVSFGIITVVLYGLLCCVLMCTLRRVVRSGEATADLVLVCGLILACIGRGLIDVFSEGLWRYLMALLGLYYGLLHANQIRTKE